MNYNYKLVLYILYVQKRYKGNALKIFSKVKVIQIQNDWRYNTSRLLTINILWKQWAFSLLPWCKHEISYTVVVLYKFFQLIGLLFHCFSHVNMTVALASLVASHTWNGILKMPRSSLKNFNSQLLAFFHISLPASHLCQHKSTFCVNGTKRYIVHVLHRACHTWAVNHEHQHVLGLYFSLHCYHWHIV